MSADYSSQTRQQSRFYLMVKPLSDSSRDRPTTCIWCGAKNSVMCSDLLCGSCYLVVYPKALGLWTGDDSKLERALLWHRIKLWLFHRHYPRPKLTLNERFRTCQFFDNTPLNWAFNFFVALPISLLVSSAIAVAVLWPLGKALQLDKMPDSDTEQCHQTPFGCE